MIRTAVDLIDKNPRTAMARSSSIASAGVLKIHVEGERVDFTSKQQMSGEPSR